MEVFDTPIPCLYFFRRLFQGSVYTLWPSLIIQPPTSWDQLPLDVKFVCLIRLPAAAQRGSCTMGPGSSRVCTHCPGGFVGLWHVPPSGRNLPVTPAPLCSTPGLAFSAPHHVGESFSPRYPAARSSFSCFPRLQRASPAAHPVAPLPGPAAPPRQTGRQEARAGGRSRQFPGGG